MRMHNSKMVLLFITLLCHLGLQVRAQDMDVCKLWQEGGPHWWSSQSTYCCKDCCFTTIGQASDCTKRKCSHCPSHEIGQCRINIDKETGEIENQGCDSNDFCKHNITAEDEGSGIGRYHCVRKLINNDTCDNGNQCQSGKCYVRQKRNFCYSCLAGNNEKNPDTYQAELTSVCDKQSEWCSDEDYSCKPKVDNGMYCNNNNFTCKSHRCNSRLNTCVACLETSQCRAGLTCTERGHCEVVKKDAGEKCLNHTDCVDDHQCVNGFCQGQRVLGSDCDTHYHCESTYCHTKTKLCYDPDTEKKSSHALTIILVIISTILGAVIAYFAYRYYKKQQLKKQKIALKSSKELAEELFSPEGQHRKLSDEMIDPIEPIEDMNNSTSTIIKTPSHGRRASKEFLNEAPNLFDSEESSSKPIISKHGGINEDTVDQSSDSSK